VQVRLRRKLEELVGVEEADLLMDRPPGGWGALVTKDWLDERLTHERELNDERFRSLEGRFDERFRGIDERFRSLESRFDERFRSLEGRFDERFAGIDHQFASLEHKLLGKIDQAMTAQTWRLVGVLISLAAIVVAALKV
jgi:hypothetical protein